MPGTMTRGRGIYSTHHVAPTHKAVVAKGVPSLNRMLRRAKSNSPWRGSNPQLSDCNPSGSRSSTAFEIEETL